MAYKIKPKKTETTIYKTLYIKKELVKEVEKIAYDNDTSFNNVVIDMIEKCIEEAKEEEMENKKID